MLKLFINIKELLQVRTSPIDKVSGAAMANLPNLTQDTMSNVLELLAS